MASDADGLAIFVFAVADAAGGTSFFIDNYSNFACFDTNLDFLFTALAVHAWTHVALTDAEAFYEDEIFSWQNFSNFTGLAFVLSGDNFYEVASFNANTHIIVPPAQG